jgi:small subunit ribosomal protein S1
MFDLLQESDGQPRFERGDVVTGTIAMIGEHEILIDVGYKFEGILAPREFGSMTAEQLQALSVGDEVEVLVVNPEDRAGNLIVSLQQVKLGQDWDEGEKLHEAGTVFQVEVSGHNKGGLIVYIGKVRGFVPASQIDRGHAIDRAKVDGSVDSPLADLVGTDIWVKIIEIDRRKNRLILSEQAAMRERRKQAKAELLDVLEEGQVLEGRVTSLADFGAFVDVGGADGLVHLSELSWNRVSHPREVLELGDTVQVKVISIDRDRRRIGLSMKQLQPEPWNDLAERFEVGTVVEGTITRLTDYGAFAKIDDDIEGLVHISELSDEERPVDEMVSPGDVVALRVIRVDPERRRIGLSLKRAGEDYDDLPAGIEGIGAPDEESAGEDLATDSVVEDAVSEEQVAEDVGPEDVGPEDIGSEDVGPEDVGPEDIGSEDAPSGEASPVEADSEGSSDDVAPDESDLGNSSEAGPLAVGEESGDAVPGEVAADADQESAGEPS